MNPNGKEADSMSATVVDISSHPRFKCPVSPVPHPATQCGSSLHNTPVETKHLTREEAIARIKAGLERRSGKRWSVTGGRGTAWGWLCIDVPPKERTHEGHFTPPDRRAELAALLGLDTVHMQGQNVSPDKWTEFVGRAEDGKSSDFRACLVCGEPTMHRFSCPCDLEHPICEGNHDDRVPRLDCAFIWSGTGHYTTRTGRS